ncbi:MAG: zinc-ribbon domain-containing protein [Acidimicrobiia bacterium]
MSAQPEPSGAPPAPAVCPVCGTPVADVTTRCPECGLDLAGVAPRPGAYSRTALMWTIAVFLVIYAVILVAVALAN